MSFRYNVIGSKLTHLKDLFFTAFIIFDTERLQLVDVAQAAIDSLIEMSSDKNIIIKLDKKCDVIGNLYGSFGWLKRAIEECIRNSIEHSTHVEK